MQNFLILDMPVTFFWETTFHFATITTTAASTATEMAVFAFLHSG